MELTYIKGSATNPNSPSVDFETQYKDATDWAIDNAPDLLGEAVTDYIPQTVLDDELPDYIADNLLDLAEKHRLKLNVRLQNKWELWEIENDIHE